MIAGEFRSLACLLDWGEVRARKLAQWVKRTWRSSDAGKAFVTLGASICLAAIFYVAYL